MEKVIENMSIDRVHDARNINSEQIEFELANVKRIVGLDGKKLDYKDMSDKELNKN